MVVQKDFKKKKAKIGRKVKSASSTKINVKSKQIVLPSQHMGSDHNKGFQMQHVISQLKHSNEKNKLDGLTELENDLQRYQGDVLKHLGTVVPYVFEMLLSDEGKARGGAVGFLSRLLSRVRESESLLGLLQLMVSFVCSALSSLNKGVRRDGLLVLRDIVQRFDVDVYLDKVLDSLLLIAQDPALLLAMNSNSSTTDNQIAAAHAHSAAVSSALGILSVLPSSGTKNSKVSKKKTNEKQQEQRSYVRGQADSQHIKKSTFACLLDALLALCNRRGLSSGLGHGAKGTGSLLLLDCRPPLSRSLCLHMLPLSLRSQDTQVFSAAEARASSGTAARLVCCLLQQFGALGRG
ncbi:hypothetical protein EON64_20125, partial [archaeon]